MSNDKKELIEFEKQIYEAILILGGFSIVGFGAVWLTRILVGS